MHINKWFSWLVESYEISAVKTNISSSLQRYEWLGSRIITAHEPSIGTLALLVAGNIIVTRTVTLFYQKFLYSPTAA